MTPNHQKDNTPREHRGKGPGGWFGQRMQGLRACQMRSIKAKDALTLKESRSLNSLQGILVKKWTGLCWTERASTLAQVTQHSIRVCWLLVNLELFLLTSTRSLLLLRRVRVVLRRGLIMGRWLKPSSSLCRQHSAQRLLGTAGPSASRHCESQELPKPALGFRQYPFPQLSHG